MSSQAMTWALKQRTGSPSAKSVLLALANYAGHDGGCYPSQRRLADDTEQSVDSVQRRLVELERIGLIYRMRRHGRFGQRRSDEIVVLVDDQARARAQELGWAPHIGVQARQTMLVQQDAEPKAADCGPGDEEAEEAAPTPQSAVAYTATGGVPKPHSCGTEPKQEPKQESPPAPKGELGGGGSIDLWERFEAAWSFDDPTDRIEPAKRAFARLQDGDKAAAVEAAPRYRDQCRLRNRKVCHAKTWINDRGWQSFRAAAASAAAASQGRAGDVVWIEAGTGEAAAWSRYNRSIGIVGGLFMTTQTRPDGERALGAYKPTRWPPSGIGQASDVAASPANGEHAES